MKRHTPIAAVLLLGTFGALAQGYVNFSMRVTGVVVAHVYLGGDFRSGNTASETPPGTQVYAGPLVQGSGYSATLWAATGAGQLESSLTLVPGSLTSFRTGATLGGTPAPLILQVPVVPAGGTGTFQIRAWNNLNGTLGSYADAVVAGSPAGKSDLFDVSNLGDGGQNLPADLANARSFSFYLRDHPGPLTITLTSTNTAVVLWPYDYPSTTALEENPTLAPTNWTSATLTVSSNNSLSWVVVPVNTGNKFYRLKQ